MTDNRNVDRWNLRANVVAILACVYGIAIAEITPRLHSALLAGLVCGTLAAPVLASVLWAAPGRTP